jgi:hypothetical protein
VDVGKVDGEEGLVLFFSHCRAAPFGRLADGSPEGS